MEQPDWDHKHPGPYPAYTDTQHGPNSHTHGADGKVDTVMGKSTNRLASVVERNRIMVNIYTNKCDTCGKLIPANLPMNGTCVSCYWRDTYRKEEQRER